MNKIKKGLGAAALAGAAALGHAPNAHALVDPRVVGDTTRGASYMDGKLYYQGRTFNVQAEPISADQAQSATVVQVRSKDIDKHMAQPTTGIAIIGDRAYIIK